MIEIGRKQSKVNGITWKAGSANINNVEGGTSGGHVNGAAREDLLAGRTCEPEIGAAKRLDQRSI